MGVVPLQFQPGESKSTLGLTGREVYDVEGIRQGPQPGQTVTVRAAREDDSQRTFEALVRIDTPIEVEYYRHRGILPYVLRLLLKS
jgi:aconitate hydratase